MRYSLRSMFLIVLIVAMPLAWYGAMKLHLERRRAAKRQIERVGAYLNYGVDYTMGNRPSGPSANLGRLMFADDFAFYEIKSISFGPVPAATNSQVAMIDQFPALTSLSVNSAAFTEEGLSCLRSVPKLEDLSLYQTPVRGEAGVKLICDLRYLNFLVIPMSTPLSIQQAFEKRLGVSGERNQGDNGDLVVFDIRG